MDLEASKHLGILPRQRRIIQQVAIILVQVLEISVQATLARSMEEVMELSPPLKVASKLMNAYQQAVLLAQRLTPRDHPRSRPARRAILMVTERTVIETTIIRVALQPMATVKATIQQHKIKQVGTAILLLTNSLLITEEKEETLPNLSTVEAIAMVQV